MKWYTMAIKPRNNSEVLIAYKNRVSGAWCDGIFHWRVRQASYYHNEFLGDDYGPHALQIPDLWAYLPQPSIEDTEALNESSR